MITADLSRWDESWAQHFAGIDTVLHVAADPSPMASWGRIQALNLDLLFNVMAAAQQHGVRRFVFASSNFVVAGHRFRLPLTTDMEPAPINAYGASKLVGERLGKMFAERYGCLSLVFASASASGRTTTGTARGFPFGHWGQQMWVSDRDFCRAFEAASWTARSALASTILCQIIPACAGTSPT